MTLDTYHFLCPKCKARVQVTPTNANRMLHVVCVGHDKRAHAPETMWRVGITVYRP